jgi:nitrous oxidase accessory protein NosD
MKRIALFLLVAMLFMLGNAPMDGEITEVTLNASQVTSAADIEMAIDAATDHGQRPGIVTLDSSAGEFVYTADDRSINIYYSNITLRSKNGAVITNCGDGIFFDDFVTDNIIIEGIRFIGENGIIAAFGTHRNVTIRNNVIIANSYAIGATKAEGWTITGNFAVGNATVIQLLESTETRIANNSLVGSSPGLGIFLDKSNWNSVDHNMIVNGWQGVLVGWGSSGNRIVNNTIYLVQQSGISFEGNNERNSVLANKVSCQPNTECQIVNVGDPPLSPTNKVQGNKFFK